MNKRIIAVVLVLVLTIAAFGASFIISKHGEEVRLAETQTNAAPKPIQPVTTPTSVPASSAANPENDPTEEEPGDEPAESTEPATYNISDDTVLPVPEIIEMPEENWSIVLINKFYQMNETYEPVLAELQEENDSIWLDERVAEAYQKMADAAKRDGVTLTAAGGYVAPDRQTRMFEKEVAILMNTGLNEDAAMAKAAFTVLPSRCSEANYGLSVDIGWLEPDFAESEAYRWLVNHAAAYGFIERYTQKGETITHFSASPWHWRYVGTDHADYIVQHNITLEEYVGKVN